MLFFDLQLFAEDNGNNNSNVADESVTVGETINDVESEHKEEIPDELAGLPEEIARETMAEANIGKADKANSDNDVENVAAGVDADNDNKQYQQPNLDNQRIPYNRFKQELDKKKELEERNKELEAQLKALQQAHTQNQSPAVPANGNNAAPLPAQQRQQPTFNADVVSKINAAAKEQAMQMTGLTQDDLDAFDYMEEDDPRKQSWKTAYEMARVNVFAGIQQARNVQQREAQRLMAIHQASVEDYNNFAQQEMSSPDFKNIVDYATNSYFENGISKAEQPAIAAAYSRIERNVASPGDIALVKRYFTDAKNAYYRENPQNNTPPRRNNNSVANKVKQAQSFPRSQNVTGAADIDASVSEATLEKMLNERNWEDIPKEYQDILLGKG